MRGESEDWVIESSSWSEREVRLEEVGFSLREYFKFPGLFWFVILKDTDHIFVRVTPFYGKVCRVIY